MHNAVWIDLLQRIPPELHNQLVFVTNSRAEISVETIFRLEPDFTVFRGRMAGTTDNGMIYMVPYNRLTAVMIARQMQETDVQAMFPDLSEKETAHGGANGNETNGDMAITPSKPVPALPDGQANGKPVEPLSPSKQGVKKPAGAPRAPTVSSIAARNSLLDKLKAARHR